MEIPSPAMDDDFRKEWAADDEFSTARYFRVKPDGSEHAPRTHFAKVIIPRDPSRRVRPDRVEDLSNQLLGLPWLMSKEIEPWCFDRRFVVQLGVERPCVRDRR